MNNFLESYKKLDRNIRYLLFAILNLSIMDGAVFLILNIFLSKQGFSDPQIASFVSIQYLMSLIFAIPLGMFIQTRKLKPFFFAICILYPTSMIGILGAISLNSNWLIYACFAFLGLALSARFVITIPYILRNVNKEQHTEAISVNFASWSGGIVFSGLLINVLTRINPSFFQDKNLLLFFCFFGLMAIFSLSKIKGTESIPQNKASKNKLTDFDWPIILKAASPIIIIAIGAGLTIPFISLFFFNSFGMDSDQFALLGVITSVLIMFGTLFIPKIKAKWGYQSVTVTQSLSIVALALMATSDFFNHLQIGLYVAVVAFIFRQPLMNLANPMTSEMTMYYVGEKNQEIMSALSSSIWAGSWFFSSLIFRYLREQDISYGCIFYITSVMYIIGVFLYHLLIKDYYLKVEQVGLGK